MIPASKSIRWLYEKRVSTGEATGARPNPRLFVITKASQFVTRSARAWPPAYRYGKYSIQPRQKRATPQGSISGGCGPAVWVSGGKEKPPHKRLGRGGAHLGSDQSKPPCQSVATPPGPLGHGRIVPPEAVARPRDPLHGPWWIGLRAAEIAASPHPPDRCNHLLSPVFMHFWRRGSDRPPCHGVERAE